MSYKVEELLALRDSVSESAVSIDRFADEDVIKEHVLRPSLSANLIGSSSSSEKPCPTSTTPSIAPTAPNKKPSPSPSVKRGKAERLLKEHGSPPGMRVTAGGRVVPSDLPPLSTARFGTNTFKPQALRSVGSGNTMSAQAQPDTNSAPRVGTLGNQPVIWVGDRMYALPPYTAPSAMPSQAPPVVNATKQLPEPMLAVQGAYSGGAPAPQRSTTQTPFTGLDVQVLKHQQTFKKQELRTVEQTEVLQASHQSEAWRAGMIEKKRGLIVELDVLRRQIAAAEADTTAATDTFSSSIGPAGFVPQIQQPIHQPIPQPIQLQQPIPQAMYPMLAPSPFQPLIMYPPPFGSYAGAEAPQVDRTGRFLASSENPIPLPQSPPGSATRRSHAIEIKPPRDEPKKPIASALDPKSPTYEPVTKMDTAKELAPPTPSPAKHSNSPWRTSREVLSQKASLSSIDTTDFFPTNTHEHSTTRIATKNPQIATPEKIWPASPWNPSSNRSSAVAMPSWSETLDKRPSTLSIGQFMPTRIAAKVPERTSLGATEALQATLAGPDSSRQSSNMRTGTGENWFISSKAVKHQLSTYQEGYQAGYDHVDLPDSIEVLQGFIQGMIHSIEDVQNARASNQSVRHLPSAGFAARSSSLRGHLAGSTPNDSAENIRTAKSNAMLSGPRRGFALSPQGSSREAPISYTLCNETAAQEPRPRTPSSAMYPGLAEFSDKIGQGYRHIAMPGAENEVERKHQDIGVLSRAETSLSSTAYPRQFSGSHLTNRGYGALMSMQRRYPTPKEYAPGGFNADAASFARPAANQRLSGLDGAMDDLAGVVLNTHLNEQPQSQAQLQSQPAAPESAVTDASCFRTSSSSKGKQKVTYSPPKVMSGKGREPPVSSPVNAPESPKKSGEHSPAKARLEQVTNKFRRGRKDDPRTMSPEEKEKHTNKWRTRFQKIKSDELKEISDYVRDNPRKSKHDGPANQRR